MEPVAATAAAAPARFRKVLREMDSSLLTQPRRYQARGAQSSTLLPGRDSEILLDKPRRIERMNRVVELRGCRACAGKVLARFSRKSKSRRAHHKLTDYFVRNRSHEEN
jgi:hypothetical protein